MRFRIAVVSSTSVVLLLASAASAQPKKSVEPIGAPHVQGFSVTLVLGDMQGASTPDNLPIGAQKALTDMRDFLPYKSYRLLDTQWILCCGSSKVGVGVSGRLRGLNPTTDGGVPAPVPVYGFAVTVVGVDRSQLSIRFVLNEGGAEKYASKLDDEATVALMSVKQEQEALETMLVQALKQHSEKHPQVQELETRLKLLERQSQSLSARAGSGKGAVIDSTFSMDIGETVVIGTSSLKGNKALIALLTAVPRRSLQSPPEREE